jgi:Putative glutamine amidotransferase/von Willebrand factor type A domain
VARARRAAASASPTVCLPSLSSTMRLAASLGSNESPSRIALSVLVPAARVAELVNDDDEVTVIGFDTEPVDIIGPFAGRDRSRFLPQILSIAPGGGGIYVYDSLLEAQRVVQRSTKLTKFVILLADGSDSEKQEGVRDLVRRMNEQQNSTLSVVSIGDGSDVPFLKSIAGIGKGRFHLTDKAANLPTIFTEEAALAQRSYIVEQAFFPKQGVGSPILNGIAAVPQLLGYIASTPKPAAQVVLRANDSDPLLATWQYGLGRAVAFTSDATGRWGKQWVQWQDFPKFWAQTIRWTILERSQSNIQAGVIQRGDRTVVVADVPDDRDDVNLALSASVVDGNGNSRELKLSQVAPGRYEAETFLEQAGAYFVRVRPVISDTSALTDTATLVEATISYVKPYSPEYAPTAGGEESLCGWSELGGGGLLSEPRQAFELTAPVAASRSDLFPLLLALAAILLPFDVGVRRASVSLRKLLGRAATLIAPASNEPSTVPSGGPSVRLGPRSSSAASEPIKPAVAERPALTPIKPANAPEIAKPAQAPGQPLTPKEKPVGSNTAGAAASELLKRKKQR